MLMITLFSAGEVCQKGIEWLNCCCFTYFTNSQVEKSPTLDIERGGYLDFNTCVYASVNLA